MIRSRIIETHKEEVVAEERKIENWREELSEWEDKRKAKGKSAK